MLPKIEYTKKTTIEANDFYDHTNTNNKKEKRLSTKMRSVFLIMKEISVPNFTEEQFIKFYGEGFIRADITYITHVETKETIGFLFTSLHNIVTNKKTGKWEYKGTAFPAIRMQYRNNKEYEYNRLIMYVRFMWYYAKYIVKLKGASPNYSIADLEKLMRGSRDVQFSLLEILNIIKKISREKGNNLKMNIRISVENPATYADICKFNLKTNVPIPSGVELEDLKKKSAADVKIEHEKMLEAFTLGKKKRPTHMHQSFFAVNIHNQKNDNLNTQDPYKKFFIINNPEYPEYAFKVKIPVTPKNISNILIRAIEMKFREEIKKTIDSYINSKLFQQLVSSNTIKQLLDIRNHLDDKYNMLSDQQVNFLLGLLGFHDR